MSGRGLTAIKRLMNEYKGRLWIDNLWNEDLSSIEISVNPPEGIFAGKKLPFSSPPSHLTRPRFRGQLFCLGGCHCVRHDYQKDISNFFSGPSGTAYEGGVFPALLTFPKDYPLSPPTMKFTCDLFHPNSKSSMQIIQFSMAFSLPRWSCLHFHSPSSRRRSEHVWIIFRTLESRPICWKNFVVCCQHVSR